MNRDTPRSLLLLCYLLLELAGLFLLALCCLLCLYWGPIAVFLASQ